MSGVKPAAIAALALATLGAGASIAVAHESRPGFLELRETGPGPTASSGRSRPAARLRSTSRPSCPRSAGWRPPASSSSRPARSSVRGTLTCEGGIEGKAIAIDGLESTITDVIVRLHHSDGRLESHVLKPTNPTVTLGARTTGWGSVRRATSVWASSTSCWASTTCSSSSACF